MAIEKVNGSLIAFHTSKNDFNIFDLKENKDYGFHFGTIEQALSRNRTGYLYQVKLFCTDLNREKDNGQWSSKKLKNIKRSLSDGIVYLNRYEGIDFPFSNDDYDKLTDKQFKSRFPDAEDSYLIFQAHNIKIMEKILIGSQRFSEIKALEDFRKMDNKDEYFARLLNLDNPFDDNVRNDSLLSIAQEFNIPCSYEKSFANTSEVSLLTDIYKQALMEIVLDSQINENPLTLKSKGIEPKP